MAIVVKTRRDRVKTFYIDFRDSDGNRIRELAGTTRTQAKNLLTKRLGEVRAGTYVNPREQKSARGVTVEEFCKRFLKDHPGRRRSDHYTDTIKPLVGHLGKRYLKEITRSDLDQFRVALLTEKVKRLGRPRSATSVLKLLRTTGRVFKMAVRWGELEANPAADLEKPSVGNPRTRFFSIEEFEAIEEASPDWLRPFLRMAVSTGMRLKEVATLQWRDIDRTASVLYVAQETKTGRRAIPMSETALAVVNGQVRRLHSPYVFLDSEDADYVSEAARGWIGRATRKAMTDAGITDGSFHTLRHTAAAWMVQAGVPLYEVQHVLGHSTPVMTQRYAHFEPEHLRRAVDAVNQKLKAGAAPGRK